MVENRRLLLVLLLLAVLFAFWVFGLKQAFDPSRIQSYLKSLGIWRAVILYFVIYTLSIRPFVPIPPTAYAVLGGLVFGVWIAFPLTVLAATCNAALSFLIGRSIGQETLQRWLRGRGKAEAILENLRNASFRSVLLIRLTPVGPPFDLVSYAAGIANVSFWGHFFGTLAGILPGTFLYTYLGASASSKNVKAMILPVFLAVLLLVVIPWYLKKRKKKVSSL